FLRFPESGAHPVHNASLADPRFTLTAITRAFTCRPARCLVNCFLPEHSPHGPAAFPDVHFVTPPLRKAAAAQGDPDGTSLWAGTSYRHATATPAAALVNHLTP